MARQGEGMLPNYLHELPPDDEAAAAGVPGRRQGDGIRRLPFLDAGRVLMLWGWGALLAATAVPSTGNDDRRQPDAASNATRAFLGLLLWLVGVSLVTFTPVARRRRFPRAARQGAAVTPNLAMGCFFPPRN